MIAYNNNHITISGEDAKRLHQIIYHPTREYTREYLDKRKKLIDKLNEEITILSDDENDFTAHIKGLNLSFLGE